MEEVYVIRLRGVPSASTSETTTASRDLLRGFVLGLGVLHIIFGSLALVFGLIRPPHEPKETLFGVLFGPLFAATGVLAFIACRRPSRKIITKVFFVMSVLSLASSTTFLGICVFGTITYHSTPRVLGEASHVTANAILTAVAESATSLLSVLTAGASLWRRWHFLKDLQQHQHSKVIVKTDIVGSEAHSQDELVRHVSPHCVVSLKTSGEQKRAMNKVREYLDEQLSCSFSSEEANSSSCTERDRGVDSQHWMNDVLSVSSSLQSFDSSTEDLRSASEMKVTTDKNLVALLRARIHERRTNGIGTTSDLENSDREQHLEQPINSRQRNRSSF